MKVAGLIAYPGGEGGEVGETFLCHDMGMCHYFGNFLDVVSDFCVPFRVIPGFLVIIFLNNI